MMEPIQLDVLLGTLIRTDLQEWLPLTALVTPNDAANTIVDWIVYGEFQSSRCIGLRLRQSRLQKVMLSCWR